MAASYDESSQKRNWLFSREELSNLRNQGQLDDGDLYQALPLPDWRLLSAFFRDRTYSASQAPRTPKPVCEPSMLSTY